MTRSDRGVKSGSLLPAEACLIYVDGKHDGDSICPANSAQSLTDYAGLIYAFSAPNAADANGNYSLNLNTGSGFGGFQSGTQAVLANASGFGDQRIYWSRNVNAGFGFATLWYSYASYENVVQAISPGVDALGYFVNSTTNQSYAGMNDLVNGATLNNILEVKRQPAGIPFWNQGAQLSQNNMTLALDEGVLIAAAGCSSGTGSLCIAANNVTIQGSGASVGYYHAFGDYCDGNGAVRVIAGSANPTIAGVDANHRLTINQADNGILASVGSGTITIKHVTITQSGSGDGLCHSVYLGSSNTPTADPTLGESITDLVVIDPVGGGPAVKLDPGCVAGQCHDTNIVISCSNVATATTCGYNEALDQQCGANRLIDYSVIEDWGSGVENDNTLAWTLEKYNQGGAGCPTSPPAVNQSIQDHNILIMDGQASGYGPQGVMFMCANTYTGNNCGGSGHPMACIRNSELVYNATTLAPGSFVSAGPGVFTDSNCTGTGPDTNVYGTRGCLGIGPFPAVPAILTSDWSQASTIAAAHARGCTGAGTQASPLAGL